MACAVSREPGLYRCDVCNCLEDGTNPDGLKWKIASAGIESDVCFRKQLTPFTILMLDLHRHYKNGVLPLAGGLLDQPYTYFRAMTTLDHWMGSGGGS